MTEEKSGNSEAAEAPTPPRMKVLSQYIRDLSFENVAAQKDFTGDAKPDINVQVNLDAAKKGDDRYEVAQKLTVSAKAGEDTIFLLEIDYAGMFNIENISEQQLHPYLMIECPRILFPFLRRIVSDITRDGGFPPLNIDNIDFLALYRNEIERRQAAAKTDGAAASPTIN